jgi:hypothetical protein
MPKRSLKESFSASFLALLLHVVVLVLEAVPLVAAAVAVLVEAAVVFELDPLLALDCCLTA